MTKRQLYVITHEFAELTYTLHDDYVELETLAVEDGKCHNNYGEDILHEFISNVSHCGYHSIKLTAIADDDRLQYLCQSDLVKWYGKFGFTTYATVRVCGIVRPRLVATIPFK